MCIRDSPGAVGGIAGDADDRRSGLRKADHDFPNGVSRIFSGFSQQKAGPINNMLRQRKLDNGEMVLIAGGFRLIRCV